MNFFEDYNDIVQITPLKDNKILKSLHYYKIAFESRQEGNIEKAITFYENSLDEIEWNVATILELSNSLFILGEFTRAFEVLKNGMEWVEGKAKAKVLNNLGMVSLKINNMDKAESSFKEALELDPGNAYALNNMAMILLEYGKRTEAIKLYQKAVKNSPEDEEIWYNLGNLLGQMGNKPERLFCFIKAEERGFSELEDIIQDLLDQDIIPRNPFYKKM
jgi:Tfp pilus assembly protein PilF